MPNTNKKSKFSPRLEAIVESLPLRLGLRVLEIGCGSGAAARAVVSHIGDGHVLAIDLSPKAIRKARDVSQDQIASGHLSMRQVSAEDLELEPGEQRYDIAFAVRVGALDGERALPRIAKALTPNGQLFIDGGDPLREISLESYR
ncbi:class I SAM-dependent methyltransferase [Halocatena salina]|uniref:Class I SAM-dependent methyltransferase n=1 Tax=Halocatena salina TaxID=2934340 RepID=A0A8U0A6J0_9EURY|nr:class I SAM-dependent methyltransferase [Halocatena salina]UPM44790.1 class I SAM-dependent methyltransferase [Halocatena salina]